MNDQPKEPKKEPKPEPECACFEIIGDNPKCPIHGGMFPQPKPKTDEQKYRAAMHQICTVAPVCEYATPASLRR